MGRAFRISSVKQQGCQAKSAATALSLRAFQALGYMPRCLDFRSAATRRRLPVRRADNSQWSDNGMFREPSRGLTGGQWRQVVSIKDASVDRAAGRQIKLRCPACLCQLSAYRRPGRNAARAHFKSFTRHDRCFRSSRFNGTRLPHSNMLK